MTHRTKQLTRVRTLMADGRWRTLREISRRVRAPEQSVSARLRDLRKPRHGRYIVARVAAPGKRLVNLYRVMARRSA